MSEPVIKGVEFPMCPRCFNTGDHSPECLLDEVDPPPRETLYTRDDLVRVAADALREYEVLPDPHRAAVFLVDRLTKGET